MSYIMTCNHLRRCYRKGDLEAEVVIVEVKHFNTRKEANNYLVEKERQYKNRNCETKIKLVKRGDEDSLLTVYTGDTWIHENNGEKYRECYSYRVHKN